MALSRANCSARTLMERRLRDVAFDKLGASGDLTRCIVAADVACDPRIRGDVGSGDPVKL